jgi:hypothetical protein
MPPVPSETESRIEGLCARIRSLCSKAHTPQAESELRRLAKELRLAIEQHMKMAKSSLGAKKAAIIKRDQGEK